MRTLKFIVEGQVIKQDPSCDFSGLVPGTEEYIQAEFKFSSEWGTYVKAAAFYSVMGREYEPKPLKDGRTCMVPAEALKKRVFKVGIVGKFGDSKLKTNKVKIEQNGGKE